MKIFGRALATCQFELKRAMTPQRISISVVLSLFPPVMLLLMLSVTGSASSFTGTEFLIVFLVAMVCVLTLLLWATPNVSAELEGRSWMFVASRPQGRVANVLGKYFASVIFSFGICLVATTLCIPLAVFLDQLRDPLHLWISYNTVFLLGCITYGAVLSLIGTLFYRRAMVIGAAYILGFEAMIGRIPAVVGKISASHHLQNLGMHWNPRLKLQINSNVLPTALTDQWISLSALTTMTLITIIAACIVIASREYVSAEET